MAKTAAERQKEYRERLKSSGNKVALNVSISQEAKDALNFLVENTPGMTQQQIVELMLIKTAEMTREDLVEYRMNKHHLFRRLKEDDLWAWEREVERIVKKTNRFEYLSYAKTVGLIDELISERLPRLEKTG